MPERRPRRPSERRAALRLLRYAVPAQTVARTVGVHRNTVDRWKRSAQVREAVIQQLTRTIAKLDPDDRRKVISRLQEPSV